MKHNLKISIAKEPLPEGVVRCKTLPFRKRLMKRLFGEPGRFMVIIPADSVKALEITELGEVTHE